MPDDVATAELFDFGLFEIISYHGGEWAESEWPSTIVQENKVGWLDR